VTAHYGFMQNPNVPVALRLLKEVLGFEVDVDDATFYLGRETLIPTEKLPGMMLWREKLFAFLARNAARATAFYGIPPDRVVELGLQVEL
jgi:KUP system potassium uptake protein